MGILSECLYPSQIGQFLLYAGLMYVVLIVFIFMSFYYDYVDRTEDEETKALTEKNVNVSNGINGKEKLVYQSDVCTVAERSEATKF